MAMAVLMVSGLPQAGKIACASANALVYVATDAQSKAAIPATAAMSMFRGVILVHLLSALCGCFLEPFLDERTNDGTHGNSACHTSLS
jgi:hypothetical protein